MIRMKKDTLEKTAVLVGSFALLAGLMRVRAEECLASEACQSCQVCETCQAGEVCNIGCEACQVKCEYSCEAVCEYSCEVSCQNCEACETSEVCTVDCETLCQTALELCENCENAEVPPVSLPPASVKRVSKVISFSKTIDGSYEVMREDTSGAIKELLFVSPSDNYKVRIVLDGDTAYDDSFSDLASVSQSLNDVAAYSSGGNYYLNILNLYYLKSCTVIIETFESIAFSKLYIKYEVLEYA